MSGALTPPRPNDAFTRLTHGPTLRPCCTHVIIVLHAPLMSPRHEPIPTYSANTCVRLSHAGTAATAKKSTMPSAAMIAWPLCRASIGPTIDEPSVLPSPSPVKTLPIAVDVTCTCRASVGPAGPRMFTDVPATKSARQ